MRIFKVSPGDNLSMPGVNYRLGQVKKDTPEWAVFQSFSSNYYSGLDMSCYFDNIFMDEIIQLQYQEVENVRPNFSYADITYRSATHGSRLVQGSFAINFKEGGYLYKLLNYLRDTDTQSQKLKALLDSNGGGNHMLASTLIAETASSEAEQMTDDTMALRNMALKGDYTIEDFVNGTTKFSSDNINKWSDYMDALDSTFWGGKLNGNRFNIDPEDSPTTSKHYMKHTKYQTREKGFDIRLKFGQPEDNMTDIQQDSSKGIPRWGTLEVLRNCHITGHSKGIDDSGRPIVEVYSFICASVS